jgi:hypothetical protein
MAVTNSVSPQAPVRSLLTALAFPLQLPSLLFIIVSSLIIALVPRGSAVGLITSILPLYLMAVWLTQFAFRIMDDVTEGRPEAPTATVEMMGPFGDARCWVHPALAAALSLLLRVAPSNVTWPVLAVAWLLFPASIGAMALSGRARDALNPPALWTVLRGLQAWYLVLLGALLGGAVLATWLVRSNLWDLPRVALLELLLLETYALIGGVLHLRRLELGYEPQHSPERQQERVETERMRQRQHVFDDVYQKLRVRENAKAVAAAGAWLQPLSAVDIQRDVLALIEASRSWSEAKGFGRLAQGAIPLLLSAQRPGPALALADEALRQDETFAPAEDGEAVALARHAMHSGRRRLAAVLIRNTLDQLKDQPPSAALLALQAHLQDHVVPSKR